MKKIIVILMVLFLFGCTQTNNDAAKFKKEYEQYNGEVDDSGHVYPLMEIDKDNPIVYISQSEAIDILKEGSGIIYFGFPTCPWCRSGVPVLLEAAKNKGIKKIYYCNNKKYREEYKLDDNGQIILTNEESKEYQEILELLGDKASEYLGLEEYGLKRLYYPTFVFVYSGQIVGFHESTLEDGVPSETIITDPYIPMTKIQHDTLLKIFENLIDSLSGCKLNQKC